MVAGGSSSFSVRLLGAGLRAILTSAVSAVKQRPRGPVCAARFRLSTVGVAQLVELLVVVQAVGGSSPLAHPHAVLVAARALAEIRRGAPMGGSPAASASETCEHGPVASQP